MQTTNISPDKDTWTLVATDPGYIRVKSNSLSDSRWWCIAVTDGGEPDEEVIGERYLGSQFAEFAQVVGEVYLLTRRDGDQFAITIGPSPAGGSSTDREIVTTTYRAISNDEVMSEGDILTLVQVLDVSGSEAITISTIWRNQTTNTDLNSPPSSDNIELVGSLGLSNAELRSAAVKVFDKDDPFTIVGRVPDESKNVVFSYADGTFETFFYTTDGDLAGKGARE